MNWTRALLSLMVLTAAVAPAQDIHSGEAVLHAMHDRYPAWYETLTFTQKSTTYNPDGSTKVETWYEAAMLPGKLRIDLGKPAENNGYIFADGKVTVVHDAKPAPSRPLFNLLLVLGFDVYRQTPETTAGILKGEGVDLSKVHEEVLEGNPVYVIGADKGDSQSKQFWVEKERLLFVRLFQPSKKDSKEVEDIRFVNYRRLAGGWIAARVEVHAAGKLVFSEEYSDIKANVKLKPEAFDGEKFASTHWENQ
jgi:outer membrane lipoprotein-sorting protein